MNCGKIQVYCLHHPSLPINTNSLPLSLTVSLNISLWEKILRFYFNSLKKCQRKSCLYVLFCRGFLSLKCVSMLLGSKADNFLITVVIFQTKNFNSFTTRNVFSLVGGYWDVSYLIINKRKFVFFNANTCWFFTMIYVRAI